MLLTLTNLLRIHSRPPKNWACCCCCYCCICLCQHTKSSCSFSKGWRETVLIVVFFTFEYSRHSLFWFLQNCITYRGDLLPRDGSRILSQWGRSIKKKKLQIDIHIVLKNYKYTKLLFLNTLYIKTQSSTNKDKNK